MNSKLINSLFLVMTVAYCGVPEVKALNCYVCSSVGNKDCSTNPKGLTLSPCLEFSKSCFTMYSKNQGELFVTRGCTVLDKQCEVLEGASIGYAKSQIKCDYCASDMCNSAIVSGATKSQQIGVVSVLVAVIVVLTQT